MTSLKVIVLLVVLLLFIGVPSARTAQVDCSGTSFVLTGDSEFHYCNWTQDAITFTFASSGRLLLHACTANSATAISINGNVSDCTVEIDNSTLVDVGDAVVIVPDSNELDNFLLAVRYSTINATANALLVTANKFSNTTITIDHSHVNVKTLGNGGVAVALLSSNVGNVSICDTRISILYSTVSSTMDAAGNAVAAGMYLKGYDAAVLQRVEFFSERSTITTAVTGTAGSATALALRALAKSAYNLSGLTVFAANSRVKGEGPKESTALGFHLQVRASPPTVVDYQSPAMFTIINTEVEALCSDTCVGALSVGVLLRIWGQSDALPPLPAGFDLHSSTILSSGNCLRMKPHIPKDGGETSDMDNLHINCEAFGWNETASYGQWHGGENITLNGTLCEDVCLQRYFPGLAPATLSPTPNTTATAPPDNESTTTTAPDDESTTTAPPNGESTTGATTSTDEPEDKIAGLNKTTFIIIAAVVGVIVVLAVIAVILRVCKGKEGAHFDDYVQLTSVSPGQTPSKDAPKK